MLILNTCNVKPYPGKNLEILRSYRSYVRGFSIMYSIYPSTRISSYLVFGFSSELFKLFLLQMYTILHRMKTRSRINLSSRIYSPLSYSGRIYRLVCCLAREKKNMSVSYDAFTAW